MQLHHLHVSHSTEISLPYAGSTLNFKEINFKVIEVLITLLNALTTAAGDKKEDTLKCAVSGWATARRNMLYNCFISNGKSWNCALSKKQRKQTVPKVSLPFPVTSWFANWHNFLQPSPLPSHTFNFPSPYLTKLNFCFYMYFIYFFFLLIFLLFIFFYKTV